MIALDIGLAVQHLVDPGRGLRSTSTCRSSTCCSAAWSIRHGVGATLVTSARGAVGSRSPRLDRGWRRPAQYRCSRVRARRAHLGRAVPGLRGLEHARAGERPPAPRAGRGGGPRRGARRSRCPLREVKAERSERLGTGIGELDRVLGGGLVPGSLVLLGGSPGIGKSTLAGMALANLAGAGQRVLYVSGEESAAQVRRRAERLGEAALSVPMLAEPSLEAVLAALEAERPAACVIDSVQTLAVADAAPGSVGAVREATAALLEAAKRLDVTMILIGHVTKEGSLAGPARARAPGRLRPPLRGRARADLPHPARAQEPLRRDQRGRRLRDARGRPGRGHRSLGALRRGGAAGARDRSSSARWRGRGRCWSRSRRSWRRPRSCRRAAPRPAIDRNRLALVLAVLDPARGPLASSAADVFVNVAGGVRVDEPGADLAIALAVASAQSGQAAGNGRQAAGLLRRDRPDGRDPLRGPRGPPSGGGPQVRPGPGPGPAAGRREDPGPAGGGDAWRGAEVSREPAAI